MKEENDLLEKSFDWDWDEYLKANGGEPAPATCFRQTETPPDNEFQVGHKIETVDPRNRSSMCIATVIDTHGPRIRLRLDGTDDRNDFWLLVDSEYIHPFEYTTKTGGSIQPPLGFRNNLSTWPRFFDKIVQSANDQTFAADTCFKPPPPKPPKNEFRMGHKLEAVDQKNPHLICPASVTDVDNDQLLVSFDGWSQSCNFWCHYASRDIFPVGWCKRAGHLLQSPGNYDEKRKSNIRRSTNLHDRSNTHNTTSTSLSNAPDTPKKSASTATPVASTVNTSKQQIDVNELNRTLNDSSHQNPIKNTSISEPQLQIPAPATTETEVPQTSTPEKTVASQANTIKKKKSIEGNSHDIDLNLVKSEAIDHSLDTNNQHVSENGAKGQKNKTKDDNKTESENKFYVYVNRKVDCGKFLDTKRFHTNNKRFCSDTPKSLFKLILQEFINSAFDPTRIFDLMQDGDSTSYIRFKTATRNERKYLPKIENEAQLWDNLRLMCKSFSIDENLFSKQKLTKTKKQPKTAQSAAVQAAVVTTNGHAEDVSGGSGVTNGHSNSKEASPTSKQATLLDSVNNFKLKRRSSSSESFHNTQHKLIKTDISDNPYLWDPEYVGNYVMQADVNLAPYVNVMRYQEIDGRALLLLTTDVMMKYMGLKLGPALKLSNIIEKLKKQR